MKNNNNATMQDVLEAINEFSNDTEKRFTGIENRLDGIDGRIDGIDKRLKHVENHMVTKQYLDEKLFDLRGDLIITMRKEDAKLRTLLDILAEKSVISQNERQRIIAMEPFPERVLEKIQ